MIYNLVVWLFFFNFTFPSFPQYFIPFSFTLSFPCFFPGLSSWKSFVLSLYHKACLRPLLKTHLPHFSQGFFSPLWVHLLLHKISFYLHYIGIRSQITWGSLFFLIFIKHFVSNNIIKTANGLAAFYLNSKFWDF